MRSHSTHAASRDEGGLYESGIKSHFYLDFNRQTAREKTYQTFEAIVVVLSADLALADLKEHRKHNLHDHASPDRPNINCQHTSPRDVDDASSPVMRQ